MINVIGLGYIGLPTAIMLALSGNDVIGTDYNKDLIDKLNSKSMTFKEEGLEGLLDKAIQKGIKFTTQYQEADIYIISVPTPYVPTTKKVDTLYLRDAVNSILAICCFKAIIVIESTISPGTIDNIIRPIIETSNKDISLVHAPERIIPGNMIYELIHNNRTIGADDKRVGEDIKKLYAGFCKGGIEVTDIRTAEMTKVVENTFRDINIAYANELLQICRESNVDVYEVIRIANKHPRVNILSPGPGVGGHCISVDPWFLVGDYPEYTKLIKTARIINDSMPEYVLKRVYEIMKENNMSDISKVGFYGLTYKENVDDVRESPTLQIIKSMEEHLSGALVQVYDPMVKKSIVANQHHSLDSFLSSCELIVILVGHKEIIDNMCKLDGKLVLDTRNVYNGKNSYRL